ncbi:unnamed protein product [Acanthoscelides obtectus]|uniref:Uncharacterized protein n=1 Tax=Acanthoscelides obtectus TaxID=200917 RepID=A0A9P0PWA9_ACAOB|nr:unnamed protein product [Acanthoscelides obtectus]CAK1672144.1 hypothetical protein AOBTE_LOCUS28676 [Acanthoscelides obtectus]
MKTLTMLLSVFAVASAKPSILAAGPGIITSATAPGAILTGPSAIGAPGAIIGVPGILGAPSAILASPAAIATSGTILTSPGAAIGLAGPAAIATAPATSAVVTGPAGTIDTSNGLLASGLIRAPGLIGKGLIIG